MKPLFLVLSSLCLGLGSMAMAQDLTDEQLLEMFEKQRAAFDEARQSGTGRTRSLSIVSVESEAPVTETTAEATPQPQATEITHGQLTEDLQINVRIEFAFDSAALGPGQKQKLAQLCSVMRQSPIGLFRIIGHTDAQGSDAYNEHLSLLRAQEVKRYFTSDCGMSPARLEAVGFGEQFLFNPADPAAGENRRVEFQALS